MSNYGIQSYCFDLPTFSDWLNEYFLLIFALQPILLHLQLNYIVYKQVCPSGQGVRLKNE